MTKVRAALYCRVSTEDQAKKYGLDVQLEKLRREAAARGYTVAGEFVDDGVTGTTDERRALTRLLAALRRQEVDLVLVVDVSRFARKFLLSLQLAAEVRRYARLEFLGVPPNDGSPEAVMMEQIMAVFAEAEHGRIRRNTIGARLTKARDHGLRASGRAPYGYRVGPTPGTTVPDQDEAPILRQLFAWYDEGRTLNDIRRELDQRGVVARSGRPWGLSTLLVILRNRVAIGQGGYNRRGKPEKDWIAVPYPALVSEEVFARVQAKLTRNKRERSGRRGDPASFLRGLLFCSLCGWRLTARRQRARRYYECMSGRFTRKPSCRIRYRADLVEAAAWDRYTAILRDPTRLADLLAEYDRGTAVNDVELQSAVAHSEGKLRKVEREIARALDLLGDDTLPIERLRERLARLERERETIASQLAETRARATRNPRPTVETLRDRCAELGRALDGPASTDPIERAAFLRDLVDRIVIRDDMVEVHSVLFPERLPVESAPLRSVSAFQEKPVKSVTDAEPLRYVVALPLNPALTRRRGV